MRASRGKTTSLKHTCNKEATEASQQTFTAQSYSTRLGSDVLYYSLPNPPGLPTVSPDLSSDTAACIVVLPSCLQSGTA